MRYTPGTLVWGAKGKNEADLVRVEEAFPAIVSKAQFQSVNKLLRSRASKATHPRRIASSYLLSGLVKVLQMRDGVYGPWRQERQVPLLRLSVPDKAWQREL